MSRRVLALLLVAVVAVPAVLVVAFVGRGSSSTPHEVPVAVAGSALVAQGIAERLDQQPGDPVAAANSPEAQTFSRGSVQAWAEIVKDSGAATAEQIAAATEVSLAQFAPDPPAS